MSDFGSTLKLFAKAKLGDALPLDDIEAVKTQVATKAGQVRRRRAKRQAPSYSAIGRLVFASTVGEPEPKPLSFAKVELWDRDFGSPDDYLGEAVTDGSGRFEIAYDPSDAGSFDKPDLELRVFDSYAGQDRLLLVLEGDEDVTEQRYDFGDVPVPYYEYHPDIPLPHVLTLSYGREKFDALPQVYAVGRKMAMAQIASSVLGIRLRHYTIERNGCLEEIQDDYRGRTTYVPPAGPGPDASDDARFVDKLLNGSCPCTFTRDETGRLHVVRTWDPYDMDGRHYLPNVHAVFDYDGEALTPVSITIQERKDNAAAPHSPLDEAKTWRPGEDGWAEARHVLDCNNYMHTQVANHLARGHFNVEQFALAAFRNLRSSPLRDLLFPHLKEVMLINVEGERAIFGPDGLMTKNGALTEVSLVNAIKDHACIDWYRWKPRAPLTAGHRFAHLANLYWDVLTEHVDLFFASHLDAILATWDEALAFSHDLVAHSIPYVPRALPEGQVEHDTNEVAEPDAPRVEVDGARRVVTPIVTEASPNERELAQLALACAYVIYHGTFFHTWINDTSDALESSYAQYNPTDRSSARELSDHISLNLALSQTRYGLIMRNEDADVPKPLIDALDARSEEFARHGLDVRRIRSRINI